ncbi:MAG: hypothetical protein RR499_07260 [Mucinivorans sp.]
MKNEEQNQIDEQSTDCLPITTAQPLQSEVEVIMPNPSVLASLDNMKQDFSLTLKYKTADDWAALKDKPVRAFYQGIKDIPNKEGEMIKCAAFIGQHECFLAGQMLIVDAVKNLLHNTAVEIIYRGKSANKNTEGSTMKFDVATLA